MLPAALTHTVTHTRKRTDGAHGAKRFRPHPFCGKNARKALYTNGRRPFYHLVRMRSAVRIRPAAPESPVFERKQDFFYFLANLICGSGWQRRPEDVFHCPPKIVWPTRGCCLIFVSNLASTITQQQKRALFVEAVTLVTWTKQQEENSCIPQNTLSAFST